jgi:hypothetical protein
MEEQIPAAWVPRDSDRIWRGSYKGKVCSTVCWQYSLHALHCQPAHRGRRGHLVALSRGVPLPCV